MPNTVFNYSRVCVAAVANSRVVRATALLLLFFLPSLVYGQIVSGSISGSVRDRRGTLIPRVTITVRNLETGFTRTLVSEGDGNYQVPGLSAGQYLIKLERDGFQTLIRESVTLSHGQELVLDFVLDVGQPLTELTVEGEPSAADIHAGYLGGWVERARIDRLPLNGRNVFDLALLQPGVNRYPQRPAASDAPILNHGTWFSVNGANARSNSFLLDGAPVNDASVSVSGSIVGTSLGVEAIREFQVLTNGYSAEFGRVTGGIINAVTRTGTNQFHGDLFEYHRNKVLDARNFFDPNKKPNFLRNQFGFALGGPIRKDKAFLFTTTEWLREKLGVTQLSPIPDSTVRRGPVSQAADPYLRLFPEPNGYSLGGGLALLSFTANQPTDEVFHQSRVDYQFAEGKRVFARYALDRTSRTRPGAYPLFSQESDSNNHYVTAEGSFVLSPHWLLVSRISYNRTNLNENNLTSFEVDPYKVHPSVPSFPQLLIGDLPLFGPTAVARFGLDQGIFSWNQDLSYARGVHSLKAGMAMDHTDLDRLGTGFKSGRFTFGNLDSFLNARPTLYLGTTLDSVESFDFANTYWAGYLQYEVRLHPRFYLNAGVRGEFATVPKEENGRTANLRNPAADSRVVIGKPYDGTGALWGARLGYAWEVLPGTAIRGGFGTYYDLMLLSFTVHIGATGMPPFIQRVTLRTPPFPNPPLTAPVGVVSPQPLEFSLQAPMLYHYNLSLEHQLWRDVLLTAAYAGSTGRYLLRRGDVNLAIPQRVSEGTLFFPAAAARRNPNFGAITLIRADGRSSYNALQAGLKKRFSRSFHLNASYVFSRSIDEGSAEILAPDAGGGSGNVLNPFDRRVERGLADFHTKHRFLADYSIALPSADSSNAWVNRFLQGWQLNGIATLASGQPFDVFLATNRSRSLFGSTVASGQGLDRPNLAPGHNHQSAILGGVSRYFDPAAFQVQPAGFFGNLGRNALLGPGYADLDIALIKTTALSWHEAALQLRVELFNVLNHPNFGFPDRIVFSGLRDDEQPLPTAGLIRSTVTSSRQLQIALRLSF